MTGELGPRTLGEIVSETFSLYGKAFWKFVAIAAVVELSLYALAFLVFFQLEQSMPDIIDIVDPGDLLEALASLLGPVAVLGVVSVVAAILQQGALIHATSEQAARQTLGFGRAYGAALRRFGAMIGAVLLLLLAVAAVVALIVGLGFLGWPLAVLAGLAAIPVFIFFGVRWTFIMQAIIVEGVGPLAAFSRSWAVVEGNWWRVFGIMLVVGLIVGGISFVAGLLGLIPIIGWIIQTVAAILLMPITAIAQTLLYFDLRHREAKYGVEALAKELGLTTGDTGPIVG